MSRVTAASVLNNDSYVVAKTTALDGAAGNGAQGNVALFTVTGDVLVRIAGACTETLASAGGGTFIVAAGGTILASITATAVAAGDVVITGAAPAGSGALGGNFIIAGGTDVVMTIATGDVTDGTVTWYCIWRPLSAGSSVVAA